MPARIRLVGKMVEPVIPKRARLAAAVIDKSPNWTAVWASQAMGALARMPLPRPLSRTIVAGYSRYFGVNLNEIEPNAIRQGFPSIDAFFTRRLRDGVRPIDMREDVAICPSDGNLRGFSVIAQDSKVVAKGHAYAIDELLVDDSLVDSFIGGTQTTIYLHPRDYHRVHVPFDGSVRSVTLVPGRLLPVTDAAIARKPSLFAVNERMVFVLDTEYGPFAIVMIAAFGVGNMSCTFCSIDAHPSKIQTVRLEEPVLVRKGDDLGVFHLGSTVVVLSGPKMRPVNGCRAGSVQFGQPMLQFGEMR